MSSESSTPGLPDPFDIDGPEHEAFKSLALEVGQDTTLLLALTLYKRLDGAGRRILVETTRDAARGRL